MKNPLKQHLPRAAQAARSVVQLHDAPWRWAVGVEAALAIGLAIGSFTLLGRQPMGLVAALGSFTALYGAGRHRHDRAQLLPLVALGLVLASALGVVCAASAWQTTLCLVVVSALACVFTLGIKLGPPGPLMFVLVAAVSGHLATPASRGGVGLAGLPITGLVAAGAVLAYLVVVAPLAVPAVRRRDGAASGWRGLFPHVGLTPDAVAVVLRVAAAVAVASLLSRPLGAHRAYWVILAAVAVLQSSYSRRLTMVRAVQRMGGTIAGVFVFELLHLTHPTGAWLVLLLMLLQGATEVVVARNYGLALLFITPMALMNATAGHPGDTLVTVQGRVLDTLLGGGIALVVFWVGEGLKSLAARRG
jgi:hypothetical protein